MSAAYFSQYLATQVNTASPEQLLILLYNGAIRFLNEAEGAMQEGHVAQRGLMISRTINIINELCATLDHEIGGEISANLEALYNYMNRELLQANIKDDLKRLGQVKAMLTDLRDTWIKAIEQVQAEAPGAGEPARPPRQPEAAAAPARAISGSY
jgi:flagellar protein FliS